MAEDRRRRRRGARKNLIYFRDWMLILTPSRCGRDVAYRRPRRGLQSAASPVLVTDAAALRVTTGHATADDALAGSSAPGDAHRGTHGSRSIRPYGESVWPGCPKPTPSRGILLTARHECCSVPERPRNDDRREYDETDRVDPGIIRGLVLAPRVNFPGIKVARIHHVTVSR